MAGPLRLFLDLGDFFTKALAVTGDRSRRARFPSVVARRLLDEGAVPTDLLLADGAPVMRLDGFSPEEHSRTRSYPDADAVLRDAAPVQGARFAGWLATKYGADRELLGSHPTPDNVDALVRKALLKTASEGVRDVEIVLVHDTGPKASALRDYAAAFPREVRIEAWQLGGKEPRRIDLNARCRVVDAPACAMAAVPAKVVSRGSGRTLVIDIGYLRTQLSIISPEGCEHWDEAAGLGMADCVRRVLRDGQEQGLIEDELAVSRALERSNETIEIAGRRFDVSRAFGEARESLAEEVARAAQRTLRAAYERHGEPCRAVALLGGGAAAAGERVAVRICEAELGVGDPWVSPDPCFALLLGARRLHASD